MTFHGSHLRSGLWSPSVLGSSETVLSRLSQAPLGLESATLSPLQSQVDGLVTHFVDEAANPRTLAALAIGGIAYRLGRIGVMSVGSARLGHVAAMPLRILSMGVGLGSEVTAFELANRSLTALSGDSSNPNLWRWGGRGGWGQGLVSSAITFGMLKGAGSLGCEQNIVFQHAFQSTAMVAGHQTAGLLGMVDRPEGSLAEQFLHAEATNLQLGAGTSLLHAMAPGLHSLERGLDFSLRSEDLPFSDPRFLPSPSIEAEAAAAGEGASSSRGLRNPNLLMVGSGEGDDPSDRDKPASGSTPPGASQKKPGASVPTELTHGETLPSVPPKGEEHSREAPAQISRSPMAETLGIPPEVPDSSSDQAPPLPEEGEPSDDKYVDPSEHARFLQKALQPTMPPPPKIQSGDELEGRFVIKRSLGAGGFGEVWLAHDKAVGRPVAIKVLRSDRLQGGNQSLTQKYIKRFEREMKIVGQLGTRYSPSLHEIYRMKDGRTLFVMEYLSGTSLGNLRNGLTQKNPEILARFPPEKRMEIFGEICEALEWAHFRGFVHMDLKPDNIFVTAEKNSEGSEKIGVKVLDWGQANGVAELLQQSPLSKEGRISLPDLEELQENLTKDGSLSGTAGYIAPERFLKDKLENPRSPDIFDLGVILYEWMTGVHPYANFIRGDTSDGEPSLVPVIDKGLTQINQISTAPGMRKLIPFSKVMTGDVPSYFQEMERIAFKAMSQEPADRYRTANEMRDDVILALAHTERNQIFGDRNKDFLDAFLNGERSEREFELFESLLAGTMTQTAFEGFQKSVRGEISLADLDSLMSREPEKGEGEEKSKFAHLDLSLREEVKYFDKRMQQAWNRFSLASQIDEIQWRRMHRPMNQLIQKRAEMNQRTEDLVNHLTKVMPQLSNPDTAKRLIAELSLSRLYYGGDRMPQKVREALMKRIREAVASIKNPTEADRSYAQALDGKIALNLHLADLQSGERLPESVGIRIVPYLREQDGQGNELENYREAPERGSSTVLSDLRDLIPLGAGYYSLEVSHPGYVTMRVPLHIRLKDVRQSLLTGEPLSLRVDLVPENLLRTRAGEKVDMVVVPGGRATLGHDFYHDGSPINVYSRPMRKIRFDSFATSREPVNVGEYAEFVRSLIADANRLIEQNLLTEARTLLQTIRDVLPQTRSGPVEIGSLPWTVEGGSLEQAFADENFNWKIDVIQGNGRIRYELKDFSLYSDLHGDPITPDQPMSFINYLSAERYTSWLSEKQGLPYRIITADQKEIISRNSFEWSFPWGYEFDPNLLLTRLSFDDPLKNAYPRATGYHPQGSEKYRDYSLYGNERGPILDLLGNVREFTSSEEETDTVFLSGGSVRSPFGALFVPASRPYMTKSVWSEHANGGFRLVLDLYSLKIKS